MIKGNALNHITVLRKCSYIFIYNCIFLNLSQFWVEIGAVYNGFCKPQSCQKQKDNYSTAYKLYFPMSISPTCLFNSTDVFLSLFLGFIFASLEWGFLGFCIQAVGPIFTRTTDILVTFRVGDLVFPTPTTTRQ